MCFNLANVDAPLDTEPGAVASEGLCLMPMWSIQPWRQVFHQDQAMVFLQSFSMRSLVVLVTTSRSTISIPVLIFLLNGNTR